MKTTYFAALPLLCAVACGGSKPQGDEPDGSAPHQTGPDAGAGRDVEQQDSGPGETTKDAAVTDVETSDGDVKDAGHETAGDTGGVIPPGSTHEPAGMSEQINTGPITALPPVNFTMFSPVAMTSTGESSNNLVLVPDGTGLRLLYNPSLSGGYSPVRFGTGISGPGSTNYYQRWRVRTVANWAGPRNGNGVKMCEPRALDVGAGDDAGTNDILMMWPNGGETDQMSAMEGLQGPDGHFADLGVNQGLVASFTDGVWHVDERIYVAESTPGAGDGQYYAYLDGTLVAKYTDVLWLAAGGTWGINYWMVDPTFGGAPETTHPLAGDFWDFDQLYVSTK